MAAGVAAGLLLTLAAGHLLRAMLPSASARTNPRALAGAVLALALAALLAIVIPARQAASVSAMDAMRIE